MATNTSIANSSHFHAALKAGKEYPDIYTCTQDWLAFHTDFTSLVKLCIINRVDDDLNLASRDSEVVEILHHEMVSKYDTKAQANGRPPLLQLAMEQAKGKTVAEIDEEMQGGLRELAEGKLYAELLPIFMRWMT